MAGFGGKFHGKKGGSWQEQRTIVPKENRTSTDGIVHRTRAECRRWNELRLLEQHGHIRNLRREVKYKLQRISDDGFGISIKSRKGNVRTYTADFVYEVKYSSHLVEEYGKNTSPDDLMWWQIIEDVKGFLEPAQELRLDVFEALYCRKVYINKV